MAATSVAILGPEAVKEFRNLLRRIRREWRPKGFEEERLVEERALLYARLGWCARADATAFAIAARDERARQEDETDAGDDGTSNGTGHDSSLECFAFPEGAHMRKRARYERELRAHLKAGAQELQKIQRARHALEEAEEAAAAEA